MRLRIAGRLLLSFLMALLAFALVSSLLFSSFFTQAVIKNKRQEMQDKARPLSRALTAALTESGRPGRGGRGGYREAVRMLTLAQDNIWVLDENLAFLSAGLMSGRTLSYKELPPDAERLVREVFLGEQPFTEAFSEMMGYPSLTIGVPIYQGEQVAGALLMHDAVAGMQYAARQGQRLLLLAGGLALVLALLIAALLSFSFTRPIKGMKAVAQRLIAGDYAARTGIDTRDEMGELAQALDALSLRLMEAQDAGEQLEQQRKDFLAAVAHELRTPLTVLRASLEALKDGVVQAPGKVADYHGQMLLEVCSLQRLVNDLMELSRLQNPGFTIEKAPLSLQEVLEDALGSARQLAMDKDIRLDLEVAASPGPFPGDYARLKQMLLVVLDNAVKFSPAGSQVQLRLDSQQILVADQGPGIPEADLPLLFDRFHKGRFNAAGAGSGLGLAIARQIALRHGMTIQVDSQEGQGTRVRFSWPAIN